MIKNRLEAPEAYWKLSKVEKKRICNGCGPSGWLGTFVPDTVIFLSISAACDIHDYMYEVGKTIEDKDRADKMFLENMKAIIEKETYFSWLKSLRIKRANYNYNVVCEHGESYFWANKGSLKSNMS